MDIISYKKVKAKDAGGKEKVVADQSYVDRVKTLVPEIVVSVWLAATALINREATTTGSKYGALWVTFLVALIVTAWLTKQELDKEKVKTGNKKLNLWPQILITALSFVFWVFGNRRRAFYHVRMVFRLVWEVGSPAVDAADCPVNKIQRG